MSLITIVNWLMETYPNHDELIEYLLRIQERADTYILTKCESAKALYLIVYEITCRLKVRMKPSSETMPELVQKLPGLQYLWHGSRASIYPDYILKMKIDTLFEHAKAQLVYIGATHTPPQQQLRPFYMNNYPPPPNIKIIHGF